MSEKIQVTKNKDQTVMISLNGGKSPAEELWPYDDYPAVENWPADFAAGLVSLGFIKAAIRRCARFCCATAVVGLLTGLGLSVAIPRSYQASTSLLLTNGPEPVPGSAIMNDQAVAQSRTVARLAIDKLGVPEGVSSFLATYTVTIISDRSLLITVSAPSGPDAVSRANAVAAEFLKFRAAQLQSQQNLVFSSLNQQIDQARLHISSIGQRLSQLSAQPGSPAKRATIGALRTERSQAIAALTALEQTTNGSQASTQAITASEVNGSEVLDAAALIPHSRLKRLLLYLAAGLLIGLALAVGMVVVRAIMSDRLRRRDDVARALGAPVKLSVGTVRLGRWLPGARGLAAAGGADVQRIVTHLGSVLPASSRGAVDPPRRRGRGRAGGLAVIAVDEPAVAALSLVSLALSHARQGKQVVVADLCRGAPAARLLQAAKPGVREVTVQDTHLVVAVPDPDDIVPCGPLDRTATQAQRSGFTKAVAGRCASADLLLTLAALDPSLGGDHLGTWASAAVVVVTAGHSSAAKVHSVGEMTRLAGTRLDSAVLVGADKTDESLGLTNVPGAGHDARGKDERQRDDGDGFLGAVNGVHMEGAVAMHERRSEVTR